MKTVVIKNKKIILAILVGIILISALIGAVLLVHNQKKLQGYVTTNAKVVDYNRRREYDYEEHRDKYMYQEIVEYTVDGIKYTETNSVWTNAPTSIGGEKKIAYDPNSPSDCIFVADSYLGAIVCFIISGVVLILLVITIIGYSRGVTT